MIRNVCKVLLVFIGGAGMAQTGGSVFDELVVAETIELRESVDESAGTMSGSIRPTIRTNELLAGFQLISEESSSGIKLEDLHNAPIKIPGGLFEQVSLKLCTEVRTINGYYSGFGSSKSLSAIASEGSEAATKRLVTGDKSYLIDENYTEDLMLMRSFVAPDCVEAQSKYFVPLYFTRGPGIPVPDTFLAVFEVGNASIDVALHGVQSDGETTQDALLTLQCDETERVDIGYDCTFGLDELEPDDFDLFELRISIMQPYRAKPLKLALRITLPDGR